MKELKKQQRQFLMILMIVFFGFVGISIPYLIFPSLFLNPEYSILPAAWGESKRVLFLGVTLGAYPLGQFVGSPILGSLSDDYGRKRLLTGSLFITAICNLFTGYAIAWQQPGLLIASRFMAGLMEGNVAIARAMAANLSAISKHKSFGKINAAASIAYLLGPLLGGVMADKNLFANLTTSTPFYFIGMLFFALAGLAMITLEKGLVHSQGSKQAFWKYMNLMKRVAVLFSNKRLQFLMITSTLLTLAVDIFYEFGPVYLTVKWGLSPVQLIVYNGMLCIALAAGNGWLAGFLSSRISAQTTVISSCGGFALLLMGIVLTESTFLMMMLFTLSGLAIGLGVTSMTVNISNSVSDTIQGEVMGTQISLRVLGDAMICLLGGGLMLMSSKLILIVAALLSVGAVSYYVLKQRKDFAHSRKPSKVI